MVKLFDNVTIPSKRVMTEGGQMHVECKFARTGAQLYSEKQLGLPGNGVREVFRDEAEVFNTDSMESFRSIPLTIGHPVGDDGKPVLVTADNSKDKQVGMLEGMPQRDEDFLGGNLVVSTKEGIECIDSGIEELSVGYTCDIIDVGGVLYQKNIRANHIALVSKGRAGPSCRISDEAFEIREKEEKQLVGVKESLVKFMADEKLGEFVSLAETLNTIAEKMKTSDELVADLSAEVETTKAEIETGKEALVTAEADLADAKAAAEEGVTLRCTAIENARLVSDMRDINDKTVAQIHKLVVADQYPELDLEGKSDAYLEARFDLLVDAAKGDTPMAKLLRDNDAKLHTVTDEAAQPSKDARAEWIKRQNKA